MTPEPERAGARPTDGTGGTTHGGTTSARTTSGGTTPGGTTPGAAAPGSQGNGRAGAPLLSARGVVRSFPVGTGAFGKAIERVHAVAGVDLDVSAGDVVGLVGESGCGKSTLGRVLLGLLRPDGGTVTFDGLDVHRARGRDLRRLRSQMQIVFQDPYSSLDPRSTVGDSIAEGLRAQGVPARARRDRVGDALDLVGLEPSHAERYPHQFSGGQRQRIGIARALAVEPRFLLADEPVSALDVSVRSQVLNLLSDLQARLDFTLLFVAHDLAVVEHLCDRVAVMYLGRIVEVGSRDEVFGHPRHPYTEALLSAIPVPDPDRRRQRHRLSGELPSPVDVPPGCPFHPRCPLAVEGLCDTERPELLPPPAAATSPDSSGPASPDGSGPEPGQPAACHVRNGRTTVGK